VNVVQPGGALRRVKVVSGETQGDRVVVTGDLKPGDNVEIVTVAPAAGPGGLFGRGG